MKLTQYGDCIYIYILILFLIPAVILGLRGKKIKYYGLIAAIPMVFMIFGENWLQISLLAGFIALEMGLTYCYLFIRKKTDNKILYYIALILSIMPVAVSKVALSTGNSLIGFIGLSYLNFRAIQMIIEIYDGAIEKVDFFTYIYFLLFFPTISSGPIDRYRRFKSNIDEKIEPSKYRNEYLYEGIRKFLIGFGYKFIIDALISNFWINKIPADVTFINSLNYMYAYSMHLFFDFAGYSAMAVGTSYIIGVKTPDNFNKPFLSRNMKEFWTRWHISLSRWFGDYIYSRALLSFMRKKIFKNRFTASHVAQMITMIVMGFWHGLELHYIIYGFYEGFLLVITDIFQRKSKFYKKHKKETWFKYAEIAVNFNVACFGLLMFSGFLFK